MTAKRRAALYIRVSTEQQAREGESIPAQRKRLTDWARDQGYQVVAEYCDAGESARAADRPEFVRMLQDARDENRPFDVILVWKWDRFARNVDDATIYKGVLRRQLGVDLRAIGDPESEGAVGVLLERILDVVAEFQSLVTAEHVKNTMTFLAGQGRWLGKVPFGYARSEAGTLVVEPEEAEVVRWAFRAFGQQDETLYSLAIKFQAGNPFPITTRRGYKWSQAAVRVMLRNQVYLGVVVWNRRKTVIESVNGQSHKAARSRDASEWVIVEDAHEALVDQPTFDAVQEVMERNSRHRKGRAEYGEYLFRGLLVCARCGHTMVHWAPANGMIPRLVCTQYFRTPAVACRPMNYIRKAELTSALVAAIDEILGGALPRHLEIAGGQASQSRYERRLAGLADRLERMIDAYEAGAITLAEFKARRQALDQERTSLEQAVQSGAVAAQNQNELLRMLQQSVAVVRGLLLEGDGASVAVTNATLRRVLDSIVVDREHNRIDFRWRLFTNES